MRPPPSTHALGRAIAQLRAQRGLTQAALARTTGLHRSYIAGIERGARNPTWTSIGTIAGGLGVSFYELVLLAEALDTSDGDAI